MKRSLCVQGCDILVHSGSLSSTEVEELRLSVIEREVREGIDRARDTKEDCLAFSRTISNISYSDMTVTR